MVNDMGLYHSKSKSKSDVLYLPCPPAPFCHSSESWNPDKKTTESAEVNRETLDLLQNSVLARQKRKMDGLRMPRGIQTMTKPKIVIPRRRGFGQKRGVLKNF